MRNKKVIIIAMCIAVLLMVVGYAAFATKLTINGTSSITSTWNIYFESIKLKETIKAGSEASSPVISGTRITFEVNLRKPGDGVTYQAVLKNAGTVDALISDVKVEIFGTAVVKHTVTGIKKGDSLSAGASKTITIKVMYDESITTVPSIKDNEIEMNIECVQDSGQTIESENLVVYQPMLKVAPTESGNTQSFFGGPILKNQIESIKFANTKTVPGGAIDSWDVSAAEDNSVMAWYTDTDSDNLYEVVIGQDGGVIANPDSSKLIYYCTNLTELDFTYFDTSLVTKMLSMISHTKLVTLDVSNFETSKVTNMENMFYDNPLLAELDLSSFVTSKVTTMYSMFHNCSSLTSLDLSSFDTSNVINIGFMFAKCSSLTNFDLNNFDTSKVKVMNYAFSECSKLVTLNLSSFDTSKVTSINGIFNKCTNLEALDISDATFGSVTSYPYMFATVNPSITITVKNSAVQTWITERLVENNITQANVIIA